MSYDRSTGIVREIHIVLTQICMWNLVWVPSMQYKDLEQCHSGWSQEMC
jgi:hypothetical protein